MLGTEINHGNVDLFHWILNGSRRLATGPGSIFQTWFSDYHGAIDLTGDREAFALEADQLPALAELFGAVSKEAAAERFVSWLRRRGGADNPNDDDVEAIWSDFRFVGHQVNDCVEKGLGLIWVAV